LRNVAHQPEKLPSISISMSNHSVEPTKPHSDPSAARQIRSLVPRKLAKLFFDSPRPFYILDGRDRLRYANQAMLQATHSTSAQLIGMDCSPNATNLANDNFVHLAIPSACRRASFEFVPCSFRWNGSTTLHEWHGKLVVSLDSEFGKGTIGVWWLCETDPLVMAGGWQRESAKLAQVQQAIAEFRSTFPRPEGMPAVLGVSHRSAMSRRQAKLAADTDSPFIIRGPAGSGKASLAQSILYSRQRRAGNPPSSNRIVPVDCRLMDRGLMSEMIELAEDQTSVPHTQNAPVMLLKNLESLSIENHSILANHLQRNSGRFCAATATAVDLWSLHPTSADWKSIVAAVSTMCLEIAPLHQRIEDLSAMFVFILDEIQTGQPSLLRRSLSVKAMHALEAHGWPGELRELYLVLRHAVEKRSEGDIEIEDLPLSVQTFPSHVLAPARKKSISLDQILESTERNLIREAISLFPGNRAAVARHLGMSRARLLRRLAELELDSSGSQSANSNTQVEVVTSIGRKNEKATDQKKETVISKEASIRIHPETVEGEPDLPVFVELHDDGLQHE
jgi:hypothetical protein